MHSNLKDVTYGTSELTPRGVAAGACRRYCWRGRGRSAAPRRSLRCQKKRLQQGEEPRPIVTASSSRVHSRPFSCARKARWLSRPPRVLQATSLPSVSTELASSRDPRGEVSDPPTRQHPPALSAGSKRFSLSHKLTVNTPIYFSLRLCMHVTH
jgi:hypothetical protein